MIDFSDISNQLPKSDLINAALHSLKEAESDAFFAIAVNKAELRHKKQSIFKGQDFKNIYVVSNNTNFGQLSSHITNKKITFIGPNFFVQQDFQELKTSFEKSLVIMTNNIFARGAELKILTQTDFPNLVEKINEFCEFNRLAKSLSAPIDIEDFFHSILYIKQSFIITTKI